MLSVPRVVFAALAAATAVFAWPQAQTASSPPSMSLSSSPAAPSTTTTTGPAAGRACNNSPSLCGRRYNDVTHMGAHDSAFLRDETTGNSISGNQFRNATSALDAGLRLLQAQVHRPNATLELCHTSCGLLDAGALASWLGAIEAWVARNPDEVVTVLLVNADEAPASDFASAFEASGLSRLAYAPPETASPDPSAGWPTLQTMIEAGTRVVSLVTNIRYSSAAPYLLPEFDHVFETPFEVSDLAAFKCTVDRPARASPAPAALSSGFMSLVNHFKYQSVVAGLDIPDVSAIDVVNSAATSTPGNLGRHLDQCRREWNKAPNFVLVDFWDKGDVVAALDAMNAVDDARGRTTAAQSDQSSRSSRSFAGDAVAGGGGGHGALVVLFCAALLLV